MAVRYAERCRRPANHGLRGSHGSDFYEQKETKVAKVVRNQVRLESSLFSSLSSVRKEEIRRRPPNHLCDPRNPWSDYFGTREATILDTNLKLARSPAHSPLSIAASPSMSLTPQLHSLTRTNQTALAVIRDNSCN